jgi:hypothetical protein
MLVLDVLIGIGFRFGFGVGVWILILLQPGLRSGPAVGLMFGICSCVECRYPGSESVFVGRFAWDVVAVG